MKPAIGLITGYARNIASFNSYQVLIYLKLFTCLSLHDLTFVLTCVQRVLLVTNFGIMFSHLLTTNVFLATRQTETKIFDRTNSYQYQSLEHPNGDECIHTVTCCYWREY